MSEELSFTQEQLDEAIVNAKNEWVTNEFNPVVQERDDLLQYKPKELSDEEKSFAAKQLELTQKEINFELKSVGLEQFADFFNAQNVEELKPQIEKFNTLLADVKKNMGYIPPNEHKQEDQYTKFVKEKDTKGMISSKLASLFK